MIRTGFSVEIKLCRWVKNGDDPSKHEMLLDHYDGSHTEEEARSLYDALDKTMKNALRVEP